MTHPIAALIAEKANDARYVFDGTCDTAKQAVDYFEQLILAALEAATDAREAALREALIAIDALDPESRIGDCSVNAISGLVLRMGEIARAALEGEKPDKWQCPINYPGCKKNCGGYGCGN